MASNDNDQISTRVEKFLFAADLVNYIFHCNTPYNVIIIGTEEYRDSVVNIFNENMRRAVCFLNVLLSLEDNDSFDVTELENLGSRLYFRYCVRKLKEAFFRDGCDQDSFLRFSVRLASLATKFFLNDVEKAPEMAVKYIFKAMKIDLSTSGKEKFDMLAQNYVTISVLEMHQHSSFISKCFEFPATKNFKSADNLKSYENTTFKDEGAHYKEERLHNHGTDNGNQCDDEEIKVYPFQNQSPSSPDNTRPSCLDSATLQGFESSSAACNSCSASSSYLASSDYIPIPGTSREKDRDVIYRFLSLRSQVENSVSKSKSKTCNSSELTVDDEKSLKEPRTGCEEDEINSPKLR